jgi:flagellar motor switch protein FliM
MEQQRQLSQQEIDAVFQNQSERKGGPPAAQGVTFDFRRLDRIAKSQLRAIHLLHDNFARSLSSSLSAYLRSYIMVNLVSVEQLSFTEFLNGLPSPTCIASMSLRPYEGNAGLELNPSLTFPLLEILLGGTGKTAIRNEREITEIERSLLEGLFRLILQDLKEAWKTVTVIDFKIEAMEKEAQQLQILAPNEPVVAVGIQIRIGDATAGMMNIAMPALIIKMMRQKFDQQWSSRKAEATESEQARMLAFLKQARVQVDGQLQGPKITVEDFLGLTLGDVIRFDYGVGRPLDCVVNGKNKFKGQVVASGEKLAILIESQNDPDADRARDREADGMPAAMAVAVAET